MRDESDAVVAAIRDGLAHFGISPDDESGEAAILDIARTISAATNYHKARAEHAEAQVQRVRDVLAEQKRRREIAAADYSD